jgi:transcriptional regulator GlxA family with amidase domain
VRHLVAASVSSHKVHAQAHELTQGGQRRRTDETGVAPMAWLTAARIDRARVLLETTTEPIENFGRLTGLGAPVSVRAAFHRRIGTSPKEYRAVFHHRVPTST